MKAGDAVTGVVTSIAAKLSAPAMSLHMRISFATINARLGDQRLHPPWGSGNFVTTREAIARQPRHLDAHDVDGVADDIGTGFLSLGSARGITRSPPGRQQL